MIDYRSIELEKGLINKVVAYFDNGRVEIASSENNEAWKQNPHNGLDDKIREDIDNELKWILPKEYTEEGFLNKGLEKIEQIMIRMNKLKDINSNYLIQENIDIYNRCLFLQSAYERCLTDKNIKTLRGAYSNIYKLTDLEKDKLIQGNSHIGNN